MFTSNSVPAHMSGDAGILRVGSAAIREQDHAAVTCSVRAARNQTGADPVQALPGDPRKCQQIDKTVLLQCFVCG
jgi:hypothetical protein